MDFIRNCHSKRLTVLPSVIIFRIDSHSVFTCYEREREREI